MIDAIRVDAENHEKVAEWLRTAVTAEPGDILVRDPDGGIAIYTPKRNPAPTSTAPEKGDDR
jgi:hypothetical protein